jgi:RNA polymerase sigma factor (sigma-70 family)
MHHDTDLGGPMAAFPATECAVVAATASPDPQVRERALATLVTAYWKPVYKYIRIKWKAANEDAKDLTQAFFTRTLEKNLFERYDPARARFRTYLRTCVDGFVANERKAAGRIKRGGAVQQLALDFEEAESEVRLHHQPGATDLDEFFDQEWVRHLLGLAVEELRRHCQAAGKTVHFALFERYDLEGRGAEAKLTYAQLGEQFGLSASEVTNYLASVRRQFRSLVLDVLRASTGNEEEFRVEAARLLGGTKP